MKRIILSIVCLVAAAPGCMDHGDVETVNRDDHEILGGQRGDEYYNLGLCAGGLGVLNTCRAAFEVGPSFASCSATLIAPNVALTSRRCVEAVVRGSPNDCARQFARVLKPRGIFVTDGSFTFGMNKWNQAEVHLPAGNNVCTDDLAVLVLTSIFPIDSPQNHPLTTTGVDLTRDVSASPPEDLALTGRGALWERYNPLTLERVEFDSAFRARHTAQGVPFFCAPDAVGGCDIADRWSKLLNFSVPTGLFAYGTSTAEEDVGGGVFDQGEFGAGTRALIGIQTGRTMAADGTLNGGYAVRLDRHADFIRKIVLQAAADRGYPPPAWAL